MAERWKGDILMPESVSQRLEGFVAIVQINIHLAYQKHYKTLFSLVPTPFIKVLEGKKYYKIILDHTAMYTNNRDAENPNICQSAYCFVSKINGDIYKSANWLLPTKHTCGNIFDNNYGWGTAVNEFGSVYKV